MKYLTFFAFLATSLFGSETMVKVVYRLQGPDIEPGAYAGLPRTVYRVGNAMGRVEETRDLEFGMHALIILNGSDVWMINQVNESGMHFTTPDPDRGFRVPIVPSGTPTGDRRAEFFEIGRELTFMAENGVEPHRRGEDCNFYDVYETVVDGVTLTVFCSTDSSLPLRTQVFEGEELLVKIAYDSYETALPVDLELFRPEARIQITEHSRNRAAEVASTSN
jgi:hypothetical protein